MRSQLERVYATVKGVPVVLLVVQGGPNTLDMMLASARTGSPLLVLSDSGGAATALAHYCNTRAVVDPVFVNAEDKLEQLRAMDEERDNSLLQFFRLSDDDVRTAPPVEPTAALPRSLLLCLAWVGDWCWRLVLATGARANAWCWRPVLAPGAGAWC